MGLEDKMDNTKDKVAGKAKEAAGDAKNDEELQAEGKAQKAKGDLKSAGENAKDAFK